MVNQDPKLFYFSGLFSIAFLIVLFGALTYAYHRHKTIQVRTEKEIQPITVDMLQLDKVKPPMEKPKPVVKPEPKPEPKPVEKPEPKPEPKPVVKPEPKPEPKPVVKPEPKPEPKPVEKPEPKPETPSLNSLFSKVDTSKFKDTNSSQNKNQPQQKSKVSNEAISKLKESASKTSSSSSIQLENRTNEDSSEKFKVERSYSYSGTALKLDYDEVEITSSNLKTADQGEYDEFFSNVKKFLYEKWQPSQAVIGNSAIVKITINENSILEYYRIVTKGKSEDFNAELDYYLAGLKGKTVPVKTKKSVTFEVKFKAKE